jgi:hypothetical protein
MLMHPFELRARLEYIKAGKHGYWINEEPYWLASLSERAAGLPRSVYIPIEIPRTLYTRGRASICFASMVTTWRQSEMAQAAPSASK